MNVKSFSLKAYLERAMRLAKYETDEDGLVVAAIEGGNGFYAQGETVEEAREALYDAVEGNVLLLLQLQLPVPTLPNFEI